MDSYQEQFEALLVNLGKVLLPEMLWAVTVALLSCFPWMMHPLATYCHIAQGSQDK
jgi:hypothetical protein